MPTQSRNSEHEKRLAAINDPGNMLIICYIAIIIFFLLVGGLGAAKFSSQETKRTSVVYNNNQDSAPQASIGIDIPTLTRLQIFN